MSLQEIDKNQNSWYRRNCYFNAAKCVDITIIGCSIVAFLGFVLIRCYPNAMTGELGKLKSCLITAPLGLSVFFLMNIAGFKINTIRQRYLLENSNLSEWKEKRIAICKKILEESGYNVIMANKPNSEPIGVQKE